MKNNEIKINLEKLRRNYNDSYIQCDEINLRELAHTLRIWVDMKSMVSEYLSETNQKPKFSTYSITTQFSKLLRGNIEYIVSSVLDDGVRVLSIGENKEILHSPKDISNIDFAISSNIKIEVNEVHVSNFTILYGKSLEQEEIKIVKKGFITNKVDFEKWLTSEIVKISFKNKDNMLERISVPRNVLINRVANTLGGSHPKGFEIKDNNFNDAVQNLLELTITGIPAPYFLLLKVAKDILEKIK